MLKKILSIIAGLAAALVFLYLAETALHSIYPPPPGTDLNNSESVKQMISQMPLSAFLMMVAVYALTAFVGGFVASRISDGWKPVRSWLIIGVILLLSEAPDIGPLGYPVWFAIITLLLYIPAAYLGSRVMRKGNSVPA
ncbi:MAG TPA: hypothetical protein VFA55_05290 [Candidatus Kapabacteria bacterium]|nr:hypothetical protein [Candidatus Kapabacteria bacterium]